jgi:multidrug efflux system outer membrane protein
MRPARLVMAATAAMLGACAVGPDYERPELDVPEAYREPAPAAGPALANLHWWELFGDDQLDALIRTALEENKSLGVAVARIQESRAALQIEQANQYPFLDLSGAAGRGERSELLVPGAGPTDSFRLTADLAFELDFWGRLRRASEAARAQLLATEESYRNVTIQLVASVASTYVQLRDLDERLAIAGRTLDTRTERLRIIQARFEKGTVPELDVNQAQIEVAAAEVAIAGFERSVVQTENALRILLGRNPGPIPRGRSIRDPLIAPAVPAGLPSELVQRRPDVLVAEAELAAQTARIGVAEALRYPSISLTGFLGVESQDLSDLNSSDARTWNIGANLFAPLFNAGQLKANVEVERARTEQALINYEAALQQAFREVEDALVAVRTLKTESEARGRQVVAARNAARLSQARYDGGVVDYLEVLDAERTLFQAELDESRTRQEYLNAIVQLYKALGGGWPPEG